MTKKASPQEIQQYTLAQMDNYLNAAQYLMLNALISGDQRAVRALKTLMDAAKSCEQPQQQEPLP